MTRVRQNPTVAAGKMSGQLCPAHGMYDPPSEAGRMQRAAQSPGMRPERARAMLEEAVRLRRTCPQCQGITPSYLDWAIGVRRRTRARFTMPRRELVDPDGVNR